jgi:preprotein translocase subunit SecA
LEDDLMRLFGTDKLTGMAKAMNIPEDIPIDMGILSNNIEKAQKRIESHYFSIRKNVLEYDEVMARQRDIVYDERYKIMMGNMEYRPVVLKMMRETIEKFVRISIQDMKNVTQGDLVTLRENLDTIPAIKVKDYTDSELKSIKGNDISDDLIKQAESNFEELVKTASVEFAEDYSKRLLLFLLDSSWQEHMVSIEELKKGIGLKAYGQTDPVQAFKTESFELFDGMMDYIREDVLRTFMGLYENMCVRLGVTSDKIVSVNSQSITSEDSVDKTDVSEE